jgi:hypothetical protein
MASSRWRDSARAVTAKPCHGCSGSGGRERAAKESAMTRIASPMVRAEEPGDWATAEARPATSNRIVRRSVGISDIPRGRGAEDRTILWCARARGREISPWAGEWSAGRSGDTGPAGLPSAA